MKPTKANQCIYDLVIIGAGPAGLAAAIYGSADGLKTLLLSKESPGGQCGRSSCVENYLGFPDGISGEDLADRAVQQIRKFGGEIRIPVDVKFVTKEGNEFLIANEGGHVRAKAVVVATGLQLKKLGLANEDNCTNVHYYSQMSQGQRFAGKHIHIIGGANSAAQAAMYFSEWAKVTLLVRGGNLSDNMSQYLEDRIIAHPNIKVAYNSEVTGLHGQKRCEKISITTKGDAFDPIRIEPTAALLVYAGAVPQTNFVSAHKDAKGYILTGHDLDGQAYTLFQGGNERSAFGLESSIPGLFVAGDVRHGSPKGVTAGVGEGATAVKQIHQYMNTL